MQVYNTWLVWIGESVRPLRLCQQLWCHHGLRSCLNQPSRSLLQQWLLPELWLRPKLKR